VRAEISVGELSCCNWRGRREEPSCLSAPYIVTQVLRIVEPGHHQSHLGDAVMAINYRFNCTFNRTINCCQRQNSHHIAPRHAAPHLHVTSGRACACARARAPPGRPAGRPASPRPRPRPGPARPGEASERARACGSPSSSYRLHKWCTRSPPFKSVEILLNSRYGIKH